MEGRPRFFLFHTEAIFALALCLFLTVEVQCQPRLNDTDDSVLPWKFDFEDDDTIDQDADDYDIVDPKPKVETVDPVNPDPVKRTLTCAQYKAPTISSDKNSPHKRISKSTSHFGNGTEFVNYTTVECGPNKYCFTVWITDPDQKSKYEIKRQGCFGVLTSNCEQGSCLADDSTQPNTYFCCCNKDMCNIKFKDIYKPEDHTTSTAVVSSSTVVPLVDNRYREKTIIVALVSVIGVALVVVFTYLPYRLCLTPEARNNSPQSNGGVENGYGGTRPDQADGYIPRDDLDLELLKFDELLARGQFSEVWKGSLGSEEVAIKVYQPKYKQYYHNECNSYTLPFMEHENLVKFYGGKEQGQTGSSIHQYLIVLDYYPLGSLTGYLKQHTLDWTRLFTMSQGIAKGLVHLHTDVNSGDHFKPALAHRDLNTRNILVTSDLRCVLTDLGFCTAMMGSKLLKNGIIEPAEQASLAEVGTIRYLAPEVFDGAVNLRDCEASLKQADIYCLGLVLWEMASRCVDLYQGAPMPDYQLPFQAEAGVHPSFVEMQSLVVRYKTRPKFPEVWKDTNPAVRSLRETIEDCWDSDPEARLTALCVQERLSDVSTLWLQGSRHRGVTPTLNTTKNVQGSYYQTTSPGAFVSNGMAFLPEFVDRNNETLQVTNEHKEDEEEEKNHLEPSSSLNSTMKELVPSNTVLEVDDINDGSSVTSPLISHHSDDNNQTSEDTGSNIQCSHPSLRRDQSMSGSTIDTWLPPTPSIEERNMSVSDTFSPSFQGHHNTSSSSSSSSGLKANNVTLAFNNTVLHPHQGRNPTVERNTHKSSDEELTVSGNRLIGPENHEAFLPAKSNAVRCENADAGTDTSRTLPSRTSVSTYDSVDTSGGAELSSLVQHDSLNYQHQQHRNAPIPYLQNQVHEGAAFGNFSIVGSQSSRPKLANINVNSVHPQAANVWENISGSYPSNRQSKSSLERQTHKSNHKSLKQKLSKLTPRNIGSKLSHMVFKSKNGKDQHNSYSPATTQNLELGDHHQLHLSPTPAPNTSDRPHNELVTEYINSGLEATPTRHGPSNPDHTEIRSTHVHMINGSVVTSVYPNDHGIDSSNCMPGSSLAVTAPLKPSPPNSGVQLNVMVPTPSSRNLHLNKTVIEHVDQESTSYNPSESDQNSVTNLQREEHNFNPILSPNHISPISSLSSSSPAATVATSTTCPNLMTQDNNCIDISHFSKLCSGGDNDSSYKDKNDYSQIQEKEKLLKKDPRFENNNMNRVKCNGAFTLPSNHSAQSVPLQTCNRFNSLPLNLQQSKQPRGKYCPNSMPSSCFIPIQQFSDSFVLSSAPSVVIPLSSYDEEENSPSSSGMTSQQKESQPLSNGYCDSYTNSNVMFGNGHNMSHQHQDLNLSLEEDEDKTNMGKMNGCVNLSVYHQSRPKSLPIRGHCHNAQDSVSNINGIAAKQQAPTNVATSKNLVKDFYEISDFDGNFPIVVPTVSLDKLPQSIFKFPTEPAKSATSATSKIGLEPKTDKEGSKTARKSNARSTSLKEGHKSDSSEKIRRRIKTPVSFKNARLSLYDDRLMSQSLDQTSHVFNGRCNDSSDVNKLMCQSMFDDSLNARQDYGSDKEMELSCVGGKDVTERGYGRKEKDVMRKHDMKMVLSTTDLVV